METIDTIFVGIDVSKGELVTAYPHQDRWRKDKVANTQAGIGAWLSQVGISDKHFVLEATGPYSERVIYELAGSNARFSVVNPQQSRAMSGVLLKTNKTDDQDAQTLSLMGKKLDLKPFIIPDAEHKKRKEAFSALCSLQKQERQLINQLHAFEHRVNPNPTAVKALEAVLDCVQLNIAELEKEFKPRQEQHQAGACIELITSIQGVGKTTAEAFVAIFGNFSNFDNAKQLAKFVGIAPREFSSGKTVRGRSSITKKGNGKLRSLLFNCARSAIQHNPVCKQLYDKLTAKGKNGKVALTAVMHKLLRLIFGVIRSGIPYDDKYHQKKPQKIG